MSSTIIHPAAMNSLAEAQLNFFPSPSFRFLVVGPDPRGEAAATSAAPLRAALADVSCAAG